MNLQKLHTTLIAVILVVYLFSAKGYLEIIDTQYSVDTAISLYDRGSLEIEAKGEGSLRTSDGRLYSKYGVGLPIAFLPYVAMGTGLSHVIKMPRMELIGFLISFSNIPFAIATLFLFSRLLRKWDVPEKSICFLTVALGLGTLCWRYAGYDYSEEIQMALLMLMVQGVIRPRGSDMIVAGMGFGGLIILKLIYILLLPVIGLYLLFQFRGSSRIKMLVQFGLPILFAFGFIGWINAVRFGNPFESGYGTEAHQFNPWQIWQTIPQLIISFDSGLLAFCPILVLGLLGWRAFFRKHSPEALFCVGLILMNLLWTGAWYLWEGGWAWGPRLLVPLLPLWLLPAAFFINSPGQQRWLPAFVVLLGISVAWQIPGIFVKDQEIHHIRQDVCTREETAGMPSNIAMAWTLLAHKLSHSGEVYRMADLTRRTDTPEKVVDLTSYQTFCGINVWTDLTSRQFHKPLVRWFPLLGLVGIVGLLLARIRPDSRR